MVDFVQDSDAMRHSFAQPRWIDGKALAARLRAELKQKVTTLGFTPGLAVIRVGEDPASKSYVASKIRACAEVGFHSRSIALPEATSEDDLLERIDALNRDKAIHAILVQLPLPRGIDEARVIGAIEPSKDVDGFHPVNVGRLLLGIETPLPCTPKGIVRLIDEVGLELRGKHAVVLGRSNIVGKPIALLLLARDATVTICHSKTVRLPQEIQRADLIVAAVGQPLFVKPDWVKPGASIIDVGINRTADGKIVGDVDPACFDRASAMTPVPGGVGPMTVAMLLENTFELAQRSLEKALNSKQ